MQVSSESLVAQKWYTYNEGVEWYIYNADVNGPKEIYPLKGHRLIAIFYSEDIARYTVALHNHRLNPLAGYLP